MTDYSFDFVKVEGILEELKGLSFALSCTGLNILELGTPEDEQGEAAMIHLTKRVQVLLKDLETELMKRPEDDPEA